MLVGKRSARSSGPSSLGEELVITGNIAAKGDLHLRGQLQGDVHCHNLRVGEAAKIEGNVVAEEVVVQGSIIGAVRASDVVLQASCYVEGEVVCQRLTIEQGARFEGESKTEKRYPSVR
jgi:cytoskeletal protein CcmA (bactofilin family)